MKVTKTASGKTEVKLSKKDWQDIGKQAGWLKESMHRSDMIRFIRGYKHYRPLDNGMFELCTLEKCDNCGGIVGQPNAVSVECDERMLLENGLIKIEGIVDPAEVWACDECGGYHCDNCQCKHGQ